KTLIAEFAVELARNEGKRVFYTTPIKALSNQKFNDLSEVHGPENVGLLTGDTSIRRDAPIIVMTTEVLRNMLYNDVAGLSDLGFVVLDEVHYLADRFRGPVWEEVIIHLPDRVQMVSLSATVSNVEEFGAWLREVRGPTTIVSTNHRPVPLVNHVLVGHRMFDLFTHSDSDRIDPAPRGPRSREGRSPASRVLPSKPPSGRVLPRRGGNASRDHFHLPPQRMRRGRRAVPEHRCRSHPPGGEENRQRGPGIPARGS